MAQQVFSTNGFTCIIEDNSDEILKALEKAKKEGLEAIGGQAVKYAQEELRTPKPTFPGVIQDAIDTSQLAQSISYAVAGDDVYIGTNVPQGPPVEFGTGRYSTKGGTDKPSWVYKGPDGECHRAFPMMARPFLKPAASEHTEEYRDMLQDSLENA